MDMEEELAKGKIHARATIELVGKPKEHIESSLKEYVENIDNHPEIKLLKKDYAEAIEKDNLFSTFAEIEVLVKNVDTLITFCFEYMPAHIEIFAPKTLSFTNVDLGNLLNDLQTRLHQLDLIIKQSRFDMKFLSANMTKMFHNLIKLAITDTPKTTDEISKIVGVEKEDTEKFISDLIKKDYLEEKEGKIHIKNEGDKKQG